MIDLTNYRAEVGMRTGQAADVLVIGEDVWNKIRWHPDLIEAIKYTERGIPTMELLQAATGFRKILVGSAIYTSDPEGTAESSVTYTRIWGKNALVLRVPDSPGLRIPAAGYTFTWARVPNSLSYMVRYRDDERETDVLEGNTYFDQRTTSTRAGTFLSGVIA